MSRPTPTSPAPPENAYFGEIEDDDKDEAEGVLEDAYFVQGEASEEGVLEENDKDEASDEENGEGAARPASPATKIRKRVEPASPATQLRKRVDFISCSNNILTRIGHFDLTSDVTKCSGRVTDDDKPHANFLSPLPYKNAQA